MFKNLLIFRIASNWSADLAQASDALEAHPFTPCTPTQERALGWVPPRGQANGAMVESINGQWILRHVTETKILPSSVVDSHVAEKSEQIEAQTGRKPGRKELRDLKDEARLSLLPMAFTKRQGTWVWIDAKQGLLVIDASSPQKADEILTALVEQLPGFIPKIVQTQESPATAMAAWLEDQSAPGAFSIGDECELKAADDTKASVRYARHSLEIDEIRGHLQAGKRPTRLSLGWGERCQFVLTDSLQVKKLSFSDAVHEDKDKSDDHFDADVAITTGELSQLIPQLIEALGGEEQTL
ncbi:recombination-associated protein RdgC [Lampropedia aestuarii]|uniref:recombination-associated protein RdgC n=1 Tax=Lampropedia aestuarii TaxID=2562762 RepID=UPI002468CDFA|nr:recombination-associated protein RdgC [Lampropedia aestuarii]MDH5856976.1 recombination-associated protein RdgC [Lampropedia aestuarii]